MRQLDENLLSKVLEYITSYQATHGRSPGQRDITADCKINSKRTHKYVHALANKGMIELNDDGTITIPHNLIPSDIKTIPLIGSVRCGQPTLAIEDYDGMFRLPRDFTGEGEFFMLIAKGDSMINAGIYEGDYLVIRKQQTADSGDIVVACKESDYSSDEEATLKRYVVRNGKAILHPENEAYDDIDARGCRIIGRLKSIIRNM